MIIEIMTVIFLIQGVSIISGLLERRRDVFHYIQNDILENKITGGS